MSNQYTEAADAIKRAAKQYEVFVKAAEVLDRAGSFEQAAKEAKAAHELAMNQRDEVLEQIERAKRQLADAVAEGERTRQEAAAAAKREAERILADARDEAAMVTVTADGEAARMRAVIQQEKEAADQVRALLETRTQELALDRDELAIQVESLQEQHANLSSAIEHLKSKFA